MNSMGENNRGRAQTAGDRDMRTALAALLIGAAAASTCRADSQLQSVPAGRGALSASAHLDLRVTVAPSLALSVQAQGVQVRGNAGALTVQRGRGGLVDGAAPSSSMQLRPRTPVIDATLPGATSHGSSLVTIAAP